MCGYYLSFNFEKVKRVVHAQDPQHKESSQEREGREDLSYFPFPPFLSLSVYLNRVERRIVRMVEEDDEELMLVGEEPKTNGRKECMYYSCTLSCLFTHIASIHLYSSSIFHFWGSFLLFLSLLSLRVHSTTFTLSILTYSIISNISLLLSFLYPFSYFLFLFLFYFLTFF